MSVLEIFNLENKKIGSIEVPKLIVESEVDQNMLHSIVRWQLAEKRQGTHMTKTKGLVSGGGKKPFKQKGTGNARQGSTRSPLMPGGGTAFGPQPRDYSYVIPKKMRKAGLRMAISHLIKTSKLKVVDSFLIEPKTKILSVKLKNLGFERAVLSDLQGNKNLDLASRNLKNFKLLQGDSVNVFDLLKYDALLISKGSIESLFKRLG